MHRIGFCRETSGTLETKEKDFEAKTEITATDSLAKYIHKEGET